MRSFIPLFRHRNHHTLLLFQPIRVTGSSLVLPLNRRDAYRSYYQSNEPKINSQRPLINMWGSKTPVRLVQALMEMEASTLSSMLLLNPISINTTLYPQDSPQRTLTHVNRAIASILVCIKVFGSRLQWQTPNTKGESQSHGELNQRRAKASLIKILNPSSDMDPTASPTMHYLEALDNQ